LDALRLGADVSLFVENLCTVKVFGREEMVEVAQKSTSEESIHRRTGSLSYLQPHRLARGGGVELREVVEELAD